MNLIGNIIWLIFGGLAAAIGYFVGGFILCITIVVPQIIFVVNDVKGTPFEMAVSVAPYCVVYVINGILAIFLVRKLIQK